MNSKKSKIQPLRSDLPIYPIGVAATLLGIHPRTLRSYVNEGLIKPAHNGSRIIFSENDINWTRCLRSMIHDENLSIPGLKKLLQLAPCWEIKNCHPDTHHHCPQKIDWSAPRTLRLVGSCAPAKEHKKTKRQDHRKVGNV